MAHPYGGGRGVWAFALLGACDLEVLDFGDGPDLEVTRARRCGGARCHGIWGGLAEALCIGAVPLTLVITFIVTFGFAGSLITDLLFRDSLIAMIPMWLYSVLSFVLMFFIAVFLSTKTLRPMKPLFITRNYSVINI